MNNLIKGEEHGITIKKSLRYLPYKDLMNLSNQINNAVITAKEKLDNTAELK